MTVAQQVYAAASKARAIDPELRLGQAVFAAASELYPAETDRLRGGQLDPFYLDGLTELFVNALSEIVI